MRIDPSMTVSDIIQRHPETAAVLARFGLDACCGGKHPLELACRAHKVAPETVLAALDSATAAPTPASAPVAGAGPARATPGPAPRFSIPVRLATATPQPACAPAGDT